MKEQIIEQALIQAVKARKGLCWKFVSPGTAGVPDRIVLMPGGRVGFVELKRPGGKTRPIQTKRIEQLHALGHKTFVVDRLETIEEVCDAIQAS